jgi:hypothetical protein
VEVLRIDWDLVDVAAAGSPPVCEARIDMARDGAVTLRGDRGDMYPLRRFVVPQTEPPRKSGRAVPPAREQEVERRVPRREAGDLPARLSRVLDAKGGEPLDPSIRASMEAALGADLSAVRLHSDERSAGAARQLNALAFTRGQDVHFGPGRPGADTPAGRRLLAHELAHTVQARNGDGVAHRRPVGSAAVSDPHDAAEREAERIADTVAAAEHMNATPHAGASTFGNDVDEGQHLFAHELTHSISHNSVKQIHRKCDPSTQSCADQENDPRFTPTPQTSGKEPVDMQKLFSDYTATTQGSLNLPEVDLDERRQLLKVEFKPTLDAIYANYTDAKQRADSNTKNVFGTGGGMTPFPGMGRTQWDQSNALLNRDNIIRSYEQSKTSLNQVMRIVGVADESEIPKVEGNFLSTFRSKARNIADFMLDQSQLVAQSEYERYTNIPTDRCTTVLYELQKSCQYIANFQYELVNLMNATAAIFNAEAPWGYPEGPTNITADDYYKYINGQVFSQDRQVQSQYDNFKAAIRQEGIKFPVLLKEKLNYIDLGYHMTEDQLRNSAMYHAVDVLDNIKKSRNDIDDDNIWDLEPVIKATVELFGIQPGSNAQAVLTQFSKNRARDKSILDIFLAAVGVVLSIVAIVGSGGLAAFAIVGGAAVGGYQTYKHYEEYEFQVAARGSAFDITKAVGGNLNPSALSLAFDVGLTLFGFVQAASALRGLKAASTATRLATGATALEKAGASASTLDFTTNLKRFTNAEGFVAEAVGDDLIRITHPAVEGEFILSRSSLRYQTKVGTGMRVEFDMPLDREPVLGQLGAGGDEFEEQLSRTLTGGQNEGIYDTAQRLVRGNIGEKLAADVLATRGHKILSFKPSILGTNQGGIDIVTIENGIVYLIDNKALTRTGNIASVSALTTNFNQNLAAVRRDLQVALTVPGISADEATTLQQAIAAIDNNNYVRAVTNANISRVTQVPSGVTTTLSSQGITFINVH